MKVMYRIAPFLLLTVAAFAQTDAPQAEAPPPDVDKAVRARVIEFYTMMHNEEYRKAESFISDDTKDYYYEGEKPIVHKFELLEIHYSENFTHAQAITRCSRPLVMAGFPPGEITLKIPTLWRFENGNWFLYEDPEKRKNPGGIQSKVTEAVQAGTAAALAGSPPDTAKASDAPKDLAPKDIPTDGSFAMAKLQVDKTEIQLAPGGTERVTLTNGSPGLLELQLGYHLNGIETKLDNYNVASHEKAVLTFEAGKEPTGGVFFVQVMPTGEVIRIIVGVKK
jgi:hypothetical protein